MELLQIEPVPDSLDDTDVQTGDDQFIHANTELVTLEELRTKCIIPVFAKDNESTISHTHFIEAVFLAAQNWFKSETILAPSVRASHPIKGRVPSAMNKPAKLLTDDEKTLYYERMAFVMEIPTVHEMVNGNDLRLSVGGVRAYNFDSLHSKKTEEKFKVFIGFKNKVCLNLCISTDGLKGEIRARSVKEVVEESFNLFRDFNANEQVELLTGFGDYTMTEKQFAHLVGRSRMYQYLPSKVKKEIPQMPLSDSQVSIITREYYGSESFSRNEFGEIDLWRLYNLFTGANKSSYIDTFLQRGVGSHCFIKSLQEALETATPHWFLS